MAKAITEVAVGALAIAAPFILPGIGIAVTAAVETSLISAGASFVLAGIADALHQNQGGIAMGVASPIGPWNYVYGRQKVGGIEIFRESNSNTGGGTTSNDKQLHRVFALACHPCQIGLDWQLRIDGKPVNFVGSGSGYQSASPSQLQQNIITISRSSGVVTMVLAAPMAGQDGLTLQIRSVADNTFNGTFTVAQPNPLDATTFTYVCGGADTTTSGGNARTTLPDYKDKIYVEFKDGNHTTTFSKLLAAGTTWSATDLCLGRCMVYCQMGYDDSVFPSGIPNVSWVIEGKNDILDPRTGTRGYTTNAALCIADYMSLPTTVGGFGLSIGTDIPTAQLSAAANVCDETVSLAGGGTIPRYSCNTYVTLNEARGTILKNMLSSCGGRISYQGGTYNIFPAAWASPTLTLNDSDTVGAIQFKPRLSIRDTANAVKGTFVSPENAYQQADFPAYMQDTDHGYVSDPYLAEDNNERIFLETNLPCTDDSATAQRLAKIALLRLRHQMRLTLRCTLKAYQAVALDVVQITHPRYTWVNKNFEVLSSRLGFDKTNGDVPTPYVELDLAETDSTIYDWNVTEQLTPQGYKQPNNVGVRICAPPEDVVAYSGTGATISGIVYPSTVTTRADGSVQNSIYVRWTQPNDLNVVLGGHMEVQYQVSGASSWTGLAKIDPSVSDIFISNVNDNTSYLTQVRAVNVAGVPSDWISAGVTVGTSLSVPSYSGLPVAPAGTLIAQALSGGGAEIIVNNFTATVGTATATCTPVPSTLTGLNQAQLYYVYYVDATFSGGTITPVATQNTADYLNKSGYFLIGQIVTPTYGSTSTYRPSTFSDNGTRTTSSPTNAYDANPTTCATLTAQNTSIAGASNADCTFSGFTSVTTATTMTLTVSVALTVPASSNASTVIAYVGGTAHTLFTSSATVAQANYTLSISSGTALNTISIEATAGTQVSTGSSTVQLQVYDIYIS